MKKLISLSLLILSFFVAYGQSPEAFKFQTVIRDGDGNLLPNQEVTLKFLIHEDAPDGAMVYSEQHQLTTNGSGLVSLNIGMGEVLIGEFAALHWDEHQYFLEEQIDIGNTGNFQFFGTVQLLSVPYALHANSAGNGIQSMSTEERDAIENPQTGMQIYNTTTNCLNYWSGTNWFETCGDCTPQPDDAFAGPDQVLFDSITSTYLQGNIPETGVGKWSIISGNGGTFDDASNPLTTFTGLANHSYLLQWQIATPCDTTRDEVHIIFQNSVFTNCGDSLVDERDGQKYATVQIGEQCWMAENLNVGEMVDGLLQMTDNGVIEKYCYDNEQEKCNAYGGMYQWHEMMQYSTIEEARGICPVDWHLPSYDEWLLLFDYVVSQGYPNITTDPDGAGNALKSCRQVSSPFGGECNTIEHPRWHYYQNHHGFDAFGFGMLPGGWRNIIGGYGFEYLGDHGFFWLSSHLTTSASLYVDFDLDAFISHNVSENDSGFNVRCVRNSDLNK